MRLSSDEKKYETVIGLRGVGITGIELLYPQCILFCSDDDAWCSRRAGEKVCCARVTFMLLFVAVRWRRSEIPQLWE